MEIFKEKRNTGVASIPNLRPLRVSHPFEGGHSRCGQIRRLASSKYRVLPEICRKENENASQFDKSMLKLEYGKQKSSSISLTNKANDRIKKSNQLDNVKHLSIDKLDKLDPSNLQASKRTYSLAIKLPDGKRIVSNFKGSDQLKNIVKVVELTARKSLKGCQLMCHNNQKIYSDLTQCLNESDIEDKSTLYVQIHDK